MEESEDTLGRLEPGEDLAFHNIPSIELYLPSVCVCVFVAIVCTSCHSRGSELGCFNPPLISFSVCIYYSVLLCVYYSSYRAGVTG